uniref:FCD domain-containing protein n=1 Tax=Halomonas sp. TaxID=1486246 RepID=UPI0026125B10|nr:FCD domain-containing protein [Halomonas sp.]
MDTRTAEHICDDIEIRIVNGDLVEGKPLPAERSLMEAYGASRTVIREVITALTAKGFLRSRPRFRPIVCRPDASTAMHAAGGVIKHLLASSQNVHDLYQVRVLCERMLVRDAAVGAQREDIQRLRQALDDNEQAIDDSARFYATDVAFHRQLYVISGNSAFPAIHQAFVEWLAPQWSQMPRSPERNRTNFLAHQAIFEAILSRDPDLAEKALISHLDSSWQFVSSTFFAEETP